MLCAKSNRIRGFAVLAMFGTLFVFGGPEEARAQQEPPTSIPAGGPPGYDQNAIPFNTWLLYPQVNFLAENSNNYFMMPQSKISGWQFDVTPSATAVWSDGINTTTVFARVQRQEWSTDSQLNGTNPQATFTQQYAPLRDLNFTFMGDYTHQTIQAGLTNALPTPTAFTGFTVLPNGNIVLPNGTIVGPNGQVVGQTGPSVTASPISSVNPFDQYTGTAKVQKIFGDGIVDLAASVQRVNYVDAGSSDFTSKTFSGDGAFWLGPIFYAYSNGAFNIRDTDPNDTESTAYRIIGGIGTRQYGLFRASIYFGHQGSGAADSPSAGGNVYGGSLTYYPTPVWTITANVDDTINLAPANAPPSTQALGIPGISPLQIALSSSTQITSTTLRSSYAISPQWSVTAVFGFTHIENIGSPIWDDSYVADAQISYNMWRDLTLMWEYQFSSLVSNAPQASINRNLVSMGATYKF
jgi:hypothetical protein